ncbi:MAG: pilus (MSHA type) biogenesis protein MshL, partial [Desulfuromonadales bacterium]|nr:pilus (MSHA type) biogenesis protein MshL [Desulfuromonadales bacterium]
MMQRLRPKLGLAACILVLLAACAPPPRGEAPLNRLETHVSSHPAVAQAPPAELPPQVAAALIPPPSLTPARGAAPEVRFDIDARRTPVRDFLLGLVVGTPYNMSVHPSLEGEITLAMKNVTVGEVVEVVRDLYGYQVRRTDNGFMVMPAGLMTEVFHLNYLNIVRRGVSQTRVSSGQVSESGGRDDDRDRGRVGDRDRDRDRRQQMVSGSRIDTESVTDFWQELETSLRAMVGAEEGRKVVVQPQSGMVVVRAMPEELRHIERYLAQLQGSLQRQVILEAKILEVELRDGFQSGINWSLLLRAGSGHTAVIGQTGGGTIFNQGVSEIAGNSGILNPLLNPGLLPVGTATSAFGGVFSTALNLGDFTAFIELLETQGDVQVLSSPRIATVNNQKAVIKVGSDEFFVTDISNDTVVGTTTTLSTDVTLTPFFSGIALDVTPQISPEGRVTLHIHPTISEVTDQSKVITIGQDTQILPLAFSRIRESDSIVSAETGQVVVIGGLMENRINSQKASIPFLGRIPFLGHLFQHNLSTSRKSELVILLRPVVVKDEGGWDKT